jgi:hypothetical protein
MTSWEGFQDYQCQQFMHEVFSMAAEVIAGHRPVAIRSNP